jgi:vacuolar-type H+-ATPase subunit H
MPVALHPQSKTLSPSGDPSDLTRLLDTEHGLEEMLRSTREEAARLVAAAREEAVAREAALATQLEADAHRLEDALQAEYQRRAADTAAQASHEAERLEGVPAEQVAALAGYVVRRVIGTGP